MKIKPIKMEHLGLVSGMCDELGIVDLINHKIGPNRRKVSVGHAVKAMIVNALGFTGRAMYLTPEFFAHRPTDILIGEGVGPNDLNDDSLGTALDALFAAGLNETFFTVASQAVSRQGIEHKFAHLDSTTISLHGTYAAYYAPEDLAIDAEEPAEAGNAQVVTITKGYSKDHAPDLNQVVVSLITSYQSSIPLWIESVDGNASDKKTFAETIKKYREQLKQGSMPCMVMDSAFYTADNLRNFPDLKWITRVPETIKEAKQLMQSADVASMQELANGYRIKAVSSQYADTIQRWLLVCSEQAKERELETFYRNLEKQEKADLARLEALSNEEFACEADALAALDKYAKTLKYHILDFKAARVEHGYASKGRPAKNVLPNKTVWKTIGHIERDQTVIDQVCSRKGMFIIATNERDQTVLNDVDLLSVYKTQGVSVERGFRFLKDPLFFAESLFLNDPKRIMALIMVMGLSLLVYSLLERKLRQNLKTEGQTVRSQTGKPTDNPTIRWVFMKFEGSMLLEFIDDIGGVSRNYPEPPKDIVTILSCLGLTYKKVYCLN